MGYKEDAVIDKFALDEEWIRQPTCYLEWAERWVDAIDNRDHKKAQLDLIEAELDKEIRSDPESFGISKLTEGAVRSILIQQTSFKNAQEAYLQAIKEARVLDIAKETIGDHKKEALKNLTQLYLAGYYSTDGAGVGKGVRDFITRSKSERMEESLNKSERLKRLSRKKQ